MKFGFRYLPAHWAPALINDDLSGLTDKDLAALAAFRADMIARFGQCYCVDNDANNAGDYFEGHDAERFGIGPCECRVFMFDVTDRNS